MTTTDAIKLPAGWTRSRTYSLDLIKIMKMVKFTLYKVFLLFIYLVPNLTVPTLILKIFWIFLYFEATTGYLQNSNFIFCSENCNWQVYSELFKFWLFYISAQHGVLIQRTSCYLTKGGIQSNSNVLIHIYLKFKKLLLPHFWAVSRCVCLLRTDSIVYNCITKGVGIY